ncbi:MAG: lipid A ABC exporter fused ATPase and inner membrane subunits MsbA [Gammaproteobacteria bacterium]|nr:MAG: lipid A ABC exporter fused ATPase and inner membrane subunits MsbA [Gammaproteobacteria bacterium]TND00632.1 MAG: lipid A ABC exporter, fused ATPase and inner membrane subunits MsbA [Gammaproteobacteria bacterium]
MNSKQLYLRLLGHVKPYWRLFALSIVAMIVMAALEPAKPALLKPLLDGSFVERDPDTIRLMPILLILLFVASGVATYVSNVALSWVANKVVMDLRTRMFAKMMSLPNRYYADHTSGGLISKMIYDVTQVTFAATNVLLVLVRDSLAVLGLLAWMFYLDWQLALIFFIVVPFIAMVVKVISRRLRTLNESLQGSMGDITHVVEESIGGNKVIKVFGGQDYENKRFFDVANWIRRYGMKITVTSAGSVPIVQLFAVVALAAIVYVASLKPEMTVGTFVSFFGAMAMLFSPIKRLTGINEHLQRGLAACGSVFALIDEASEPDNGTRSIERANGQIEFRDVSLVYDAGEAPALQHISLTVNPGETVALVGRSGSGKTSLVSLIPRFYQPTGGRVLIDGIDIQELTLTSLRANLALVSQDVVLFNDTAAANIAYGTAQHATDEQIIAAATAAHAMEFIDELPNGLQTMVGESGVRLSGGQRQRLAIARALLKDAPILILDEATSALDSESERHVQEALATVIQGRTTIVIAHRLSTIEQADSIVVMDDGKIVETGRHAELLARGGVYAGLYRMQFKDDAAPAAGATC